MQSSEYSLFLQRLLKTTMKKYSEASEEKKRFQNITTGTQNKKVVGKF
jgi:hypothetical protein